MRLLVCLDGSNCEQISAAITAFVRSDQLKLALIYVTDTGPHMDIERQRQRFFRTSPLSHERIEKMSAAEQSAAQDILAEGERYLPGAELITRTGRPEREIVNFAAEWNADLLIISSRSQQHTGALIGPKSVGHTARFVLDHAPCPVLLVRHHTQAQFPIDPVPPPPPERR